MLGPPRSVTHVVVLPAVTRLIILLAASLAGVLGGPSAVAAEVDYARDVQPILAKRCFSCHGPDMAEGGLAFHQADTALVEADSGERAIVPGDAEASLLLARVSTDDEYERMPPEGDAVSPAEIEILSQWIEAGAVFTKHWAFEPLRAVEVPAADAAVQTDSAGAADAATPRVHPIDAFLSRDLRAAGLTMNPPADRRTLIRRATYDLTGLPPSPEEVEAFVNDPDPLAYETLIENLLASPHYGERWGRHWLDLVRYAETNSFERDNAKPNAWKYRDYVIRSFNDDKPYDQFIREQLAGDQLDVVTTETLTATGYYRLGIWDDEPADPLQARYDELDDLVATTGQTFLGLTVHCARCHDHKIDPIPQTDYYGMLAFFADVDSYGSRGDQSSNNQIDVTPPEVRSAYEQLDQQERELRHERRAIEQSGIEKMTAENQRATEGPPQQRRRVLREHLDSHLDEQQRGRYAELNQSLAELQQRRDALPRREQVLGLGQARPIEETYVLFRGNPHSPADPVTPRFPELMDEPLPQVTDDNRRRTLANWIASPDNRLTSRVLVNRLWQHHFGRGIVRSANNFGQLGTPPTHPELLDYLAQTFVDGGWRLKAMHRFIMTSAAYRMSAEANPTGQSIDPDNDLFWRFDPRRLSAEEVRDSILAVNGTLNRDTYGPSFYPNLSAEVLAGQSRPGEGWGDSDERTRDRRSVYIHVKRTLLTPLLSAFDFPEPDTSCEARFATMQPSQAMTLLNSSFIHEEAAILADAVCNDVGLAAEDREGPVATEDLSEWMGALIHRAFARDASSEEVQAGVELLHDLVDRYDVPPRRARTLVALSVLNWNEFVFLF